MNEVELRMECLRVASDMTQNPDDALRLAKEYFNFVWGSGGHKSEDEMVYESMLKRAVGIA